MFIRNYHDHQFNFANKKVCFKNQLIDKTQTKIKNINIFICWRYVKYKKFMILK